MIPPRIKERRKELRMSLDDLEVASGIDASYLNRMERGERRVSTEQLARIAKALKCDPKELLADNLPSSDGMKTRSVPVLGAVEAGVWVSAMEWPKADQYDISVPNDERAKKPFALVVRGPSMNLEFADGSFVICVNIHDFWRGPQSGDFVIVERRDHGEVEATVKQLRYDETGQPWLWPRSSHPDHQAPVRLPDGKGFHEGQPEILLRAIVIASYNTRV